MKKYCFILLLLLHSVLLFGKEPDLIKQITAKEHMVFSFFLKASAVTTALNKEEHGKTKTENWTISYQEPGLFFLTYDDNGIEHIYACNYNSIWEYLPLYKQALKTDISHLKEYKKKKKIVRSLSVIQTPFLFVGDILGQIKKMNIDNSDKKRYIISGYFRYNKKRSFLRIWIDKKDLRPRKLELIQKNVVVLTVRYSGYGKFPLVPEQITYFINSENRNVKFEVRILDYKVNVKFDKKIFQFYPEKDIEIFKNK